MKTSPPRCNSENLRRHWNRVAKSLYDFYQSPSTGYYRQSEINLIKRFFHPLKGKKFLKLDLWNEVHNTRVLFWIAKQGAKTYGLDISDYLVNKARENFKKEGLTAQLITCDMRQIKFPKNTFDYLYTLGTIEHVPDPEKVIGEIKRVLKPGGHCLVGVPNKLDPFLRPLLVKFLENFNLYPYSPEKAFSLTELKKLLEDNGLTVKAESGLLFMPGILRIADLFFYKQARILSSLTGLLLKPFEFLERRSDWCQKNGYLIVCLAEKPK